jgi:hypothetical protein
LCGGCILKNILMSLSFCSLILLTSCNLASHGSNRSPDSAIKFSDSGQSCASQALPNMQSFFNAQATDAQVVQTWDCFRGAVQLFEKYARSSTDSENFTPDEFRAFLEKYFLGQIKISDQLLYEVMRIKQVLIGGRIDEVTRSDLKKIEEFLIGLQKEALALNRHMKVIINSANAATVPATEIEVNFAESQLLASAKNLAELFDGSQLPYSFSDFRTFLKEFSNLYDQIGAHWSGPQFISDHLEAFSNAKAFFLRPAPDSIAPREWAEIFTTGAKLYGGWLRISYILGPQDRLTTGYGLDQLIICVHGFFDVLQTSIDRKANSRIEFDQFNNLVATASDLGMLSAANIKKATFLNLAAPIFFKVYSPAKNGVRTTPKGIDQTIFDMMKSDFDSWADMQKVYDRIISKLPAPQKSPSLSQLKVLWSAEPYDFPLAGEEIHRYLNRDHPVQYRSNGTIILEKDILDLPVDQAAFTGINWRRLFVSSLVRGYTEDAEKYHFDGVTSSQFHQFYNDIRQLGIDLRFLDPRDNSIWHSLFLYAHLFLLSSEKSDRLSFQNGMDIVSYSMGGGKMSSRAYNDMRIGCQNFENDVYGLPMLDVNCYRQSFRKKFAFYYQELPHWVHAAHSWTDNDWLNFQSSIEDLARVHGHSEEHLESADINKTSIIFQYVDTMFVRYDLDNSETINLPESMNFYPLIHDALIDGSGIPNESILEAIFTYIMKFGEAPKKDTLSLLKLYIWKLQKYSWSYEADRIQMVKVLMALSSSSAQAPASQMRAASLNPLLSTLSIAAPDLQTYVLDRFAQFESVQDWRQIITDPQERLEIEKFQNDLAH